MKRHGVLKSSGIAMLLLLFLCAPLVLTSCAPEIKNFTPSQGSAGTDVTITGSRFGATEADNEVKFGNVTATDITVPQKNMIIAKVPAGAVTGLISVTADGKTGYFRRFCFDLGQGHW